MKYLFSIAAAFLSLCLPAKAQSYVIPCGLNCALVSPAPSQFQFFMDGASVWDYAFTVSGRFATTKSWQFGLQVFFTQGGVSTTLSNNNVANLLQLGGNDSASGTATTFGFSGIVAGNANTAAPTATVRGGLSNGSGCGDLNLQTTLGAAGSGVQNTASNALVLKGCTQLVATVAAVADSGYSYTAPTTGGTVTLGNGVYHQIIDPAGTLATLTVNMPATPIDGQFVDVRFSQVITALTVSGNGHSILGNPTSAAVGAQFGCIYRNTNTTWYC